MPQLHNQWIDLYNEEMAHVAKLSEALAKLMTAYDSLETYTNLDKIPANHLAVIQKLRENAKNILQKNDVVQATKEKNSFNWYIIRLDNGNVVDGWFSHNYADWRSFDESDWFATTDDAKKSIDMAGLTDKYKIICVDDSKDFDPEKEGYYVLLKNNTWLGDFKATEYFNNAFAYQSSQKANEYASVYEDAEVICIAPKDRILYYICHLDENNKLNKWDTCNGHVSKFSDKCRYFYSYESARNLLVPSAALILAIREKCHTNIFNKETKKYAYKFDDKKEPVWWNGKDWVPCFNDAICVSNAAHVSNFIGGSYNLFTVPGTNRYYVKWLHDGDSYYKKPPANANAFWVKLKQATPFDELFEAEKYKSSLEQLFGVGKYIIETVEKENND